MEQNFLIEEYKECNQNLRHYSIMRFAEFTLYFLINGALLNIAFDFTTSNSANPTAFLKGLGIFLSITFGLMNERRIILWDCHQRRAVEIEDELGMSQCKKRSDELLFRNRNATRLIYIILAFFWIISIF